MRLVILIISLWMSAACIYMDARTGCIENHIALDIDSQGSSVAAPIAYHREGVGAQNDNGARQDGRLSAVGDAALKAITDTVAACATGGVSEAPKLLASKLGREPTKEELQELAARLPK